MSGPLTPGNFTYAPEATTAQRDADFYVLSSAVPVATGVTQIVAGNASITVSPAGGTGVVTLTVPPPIIPPTFATGMIMMFNGVTAPTGWAICDGLNGTPDLREKFIRGANTLVPVGSTGGANDVSLTLNMLPDHIHGQTAVLGSGGTAGINDYNVTGITGNTSGITTPGYTGGVPVPTLPPFYALSYIIKTA